MPRYMDDAKRILARFLVLDVLVPESMVLGRICRMLVGINEEVLADRLRQGEGDKRSFHYFHQEVKELYDRRKQEDAGEARRATTKPVLTPAMHMATPKVTPYVKFACRNHQTNEHKYGSATCLALRGKSNISRIAVSSIVADKDIKGDDVWYAPSHIFKCTHAQSKMRTIATTNQFEVLPSKFILDSGCSHHLAKDVSSFCEYRPKSSGNITTASGEAMPIRGIGKVPLNAGGKSIKLSDVKHVPALDSNLMSVSTLDKGGRSVLFGGGLTWVIPGHFKDFLPLGMKPLIAGKLEDDGLYYVGNRQAGNALVAKVTPVIWHNRLGHLSKGALHKLGNITMDLKMDRHVEQVDTGVCEGCMKGKMHCLPFPTTSTVVENVGDIVCQDLKGPVRPKAVGGYSYAQIFTDRRSGATKVYLIKNKTQDTVLANFKEYEAYLLRQYGAKVKALQSDNAKEFIGKASQDYLASQGIVHRRAVPYAHQQMGVAERQNRTLFDVALSLLAHAGMAMKYWGFALESASVIRDRCGYRHRDGTIQTPLETLMGKRPSVANLRVFGCRAWRQLPKEASAGLHFRSELCRFLGYKKGTKGYVLLTQKNEVVVSRDVIFEENRFDGLPGSMEQDEELVWEEMEEIEEDRTPITEESEEEFPLLNTYEEHIPDKPVAVPENHAAELGESTTDDQLTDMEDSGPDEEGTPAHVETSKYWSRTNDLDPANILPEHTRSGVASLLGSMFGSAMMAAGTGASIPLTNDMFGTSFPKSRQAAMNRPDWPEWDAADKQEEASMMEMDVAEVVDVKDIPKGMDIYYIMPVYTQKFGSTGKLLRYKSRWVVDGSRQGLMANDTFSPAVRWASLRTVVALCAAKGEYLQQMDVDTAFLNAPLKEVRYAHAPNGKYWKVKKAIYGFQDSPQLWSTLSDQHLLSMGYKTTYADPCVFVKHAQIGGSEHFSMVTRWVDDYFSFATHPSMRVDFVAGMKSKFSVKDLGVLEYGLGVHFSYLDRNGKSIVRNCIGSVPIHAIKMDQHLYISTMLKEFDMVNAHPALTPMEATATLTAIDELGEGGGHNLFLSYRPLVGSLNYAAVVTRPDIADAVGQVARFMAKPMKAHWGAAQRILRYLKGTPDMGVVYRKDCHINPEAWSDASFQRCVDTRRSTSGLVIMMGGGPVSWRSHRQKTIAQSSCESEYMALTETGKELVWLRGLLEELGVSDWVKASSVMVGKKEPSNDWLNLNGDNQGSIALANRPLINGNSKHIHRSWHWIREKALAKELVLAYCPTQDMLADIFTKPLPTPRFRELRLKIGIR
jgi:hypothetical protein